MAGARFLTRGAEGLGEQVRLGPLTQTLVHRAWAAVHTGDWGVAAAAAAEGARLAHDTRQPQYGLTGELIGGVVTALRGTESDIDVVVAQPERILQSMKGGPLLATAHLARGAAASAMGGTKMHFVTSGPYSTRPSPPFIDSCAGRHCWTPSRLGSAAGTPRNWLTSSPSSRESRRGVHRHFCVPNCTARRRCWPATMVSHPCEGVDLIKAAAGALGASSEGLGVPHV